MDYMPLLKLKQNEVLALKDLGKDRLGHLCPLFDIPRIEPFSLFELKKKIKSAKGSIRRHWPGHLDFYIDVFDYDPGETVDSVPLYEFVLNEFSDFNVLPVVALDRGAKHNEIAKTYINSLSDEYENGYCLRLLRSDIEDYVIDPSEVDQLIEEFAADADFFDLLVDSRLLTDSDVKVLQDDLPDFIEAISKKFNPRNIIVSGSSIPPNIRDILDTKSEIHLPRLEKELWASVNKSVVEKIVYGDYGVVSPLYADTTLPIEIIQKFMAPKAFYTYDDGTYCIRGGAFETHPDGRQQYFTIAKKIVGEKFFRVGNSDGDSYIYEKSLESGSPGSPSSWVRNTMNAHMKFILDETV